MPEPTFLEERQATTPTVLSTLRDLDTPRTKLAEEWRKRRRKPLQELPSERSLDKSNSMRTVTSYSRERRVTTLLLTTSLTNSTSTPLLSTPLMTNITTLRCISLCSPTTKRPRTTPTSQRAKRPRTENLTTRLTTECSELCSPRLTARTTLERK